ncbi:MAG: diguanylate cyclase [Terracidiphilus sp.]|jgi:diguanylate cyclase (GGDEF)-like protein/PAS domain S-box-containing protein
MADRTELLEAALDSLPEGMALLSAEADIVFWNRAAEAITGYRGADLLSRQVPEPLEPLLLACAGFGRPESIAGTGPCRGRLVRFQHSQGQRIPAIARSMVLRDGMGGRIGAAVVFHPTESQDALPHGACSENSEVEENQMEFEDRLGAVFEDFLQGGEKFGVLWITVDQAHDLRKTHGVGACDTMLEKVERALANGLRPAEEMGRWGDDEYLVLSHERTQEMLATHARMLADLARTADFRWWGDRVSLTVSIGAAQADRDGSLADLLDRAKAAMFSSIQAGGNQITTAPGGQACSPS